MHAREGSAGSVALGRSQLRAQSRTGSVRALAEQTLSRAAGAPLVEGNSIRLLEDATENYPAWLEAIAGARHHVNFENYMIYDDDVGTSFADALIVKAREGVRVRLLYDWMGTFGKASRAFWARLRAAGVEVRSYNRPSLASPFGWVRRDHRKTVSVDGRVGFVTGLCVGRPWLGDARRGREPWRDTGVQVRGPAVSDIERGFAEVWAATGRPMPPDEPPRAEAVAREGTVALRVIATSPATGGMLRLDQLIAALAKGRLWIADAYYAGTTAYAQALCAAARDGVDVRLLGPGASDIAILQPLSRAGYRPLLRAGVRIFEWNGLMMHAKTAVADGRWARVGSTNLNVASWLGNYEMDVVAEDEEFAREMEEAYLRDLENATELVLGARDQVHAPGHARPSDGHRRRGQGSASRAAAGIVRVGNALTAASARHSRVLEPVEARTALVAGLVGLLLALSFFFFPRLVAYPVAALFAWLALALVYKGWSLHRRRRTERAVDLGASPTRR